MRLPRGTGVSRVLSPFADPVCGVLTALGDLDGMKTATPLVGVNACLRPLGLTGVVTIPLMRGLAGTGISVPLEVWSDVSLLRTPLSDWGVLFLAPGGRPLLFGTTSDPGVVAVFDLGVEEGSV